MKRSIVFVLGMGRSGTSALTRVLALCGCTLPEKLLAGRSDNPTGHWEPVEALELNDNFLHRHGSTWFDPTLRIQNELNLSEPEREAFIREIQALLHAWPTRDLLVIKEPRITALTDFWFEAAKRVGADIKVVIPVRHPGEVSASLIARDRMSVELSLLLWLKYNLLGERRSRAWPRVFVEFGNLVSDWRTEIARIARCLSIDLKVPSDGEVEAFLSRDLYHQHRAPDQVDDIGPFPIGHLYRALSAAARETMPALGSALDVAAFDSAFHAYRVCEHLLRMGLVEFQNRFGPTPSPQIVIASLTQERDALAAELSQQKLSHEAALARERADFTDERARLGAAIQELRARLDAISASSSWKLTRPLRALRELARS